MLQHPLLQARLHSKAAIDIQQLNSQTISSNSTITERNRAISLAGNLYAVGCDENREPVFSTECSNEVKHLACV
jgi:hypothetical protein